jgi:hypothetical protein
MDDWGDVGPTIEDVVAVHGTYGNMNVFFASNAAAARAHQQTGWRHFDAHALTMRFHEDMLMLTEADGRTRYYGDWEFQTQTGTGEPVGTSDQRQPDSWTVDVSIELARTVQIKIARQTVER